jgi:hypothetical protein
MLAVTIPLTPIIGGVVDVDEPNSYGGLAHDEGTDDTHGAVDAAEAATPLGSDEGPRDHVAVSSFSRRLVIGGLVVAVVAVVAAGLVLFITNMSSAISTGTGTATITWTPVTGTPPAIGNLPQSFGGSINGVGVSGINRTTITAKDFESLTNPSRTSPTEFQAFRLTGSFGGKDLSLGVYYVVSLRPSLTNLEINVRGTYGSMAVKGIITPPSAAELTNSSPPVHFHGTIGDFRVSGIIYPSAGNSKLQTSRTTFTVTK